MGVKVAVEVGVRVGEGVGVLLTVAVSVSVAVEVGVLVGVIVAVEVAVLVEVSVKVGVGVQDKQGDETSVGVLVGGFDGEAGLLLPGQPICTNPKISKKIVEKKYPNRFISYLPKN